MSGGVEVEERGCKDHFDEGIDGWCYVQGGIACSAATPSEGVPGAAYKDCGEIAPTLC